LEYPGYTSISAIVAGKIGTEAAGLKRDFTVTLLTAIVLILFMLLGNNGRVSRLCHDTIVFHLWRLIKAQQDYKMEAIGTRIPELVVTLSSAVKGLHHLSIGTILGNNTFNILIGIGVPAIIKTIS